ncbi:colicin uptake protein TolR [Candidatus Fukatsuia anoeciicola]|uniref:colicin uptake protein TolR n=1 Tax=Candidatus Fukatsuia anoeciicola TaxID=2994492 RepID=UPI0034639A46
MRLALNRKNRKLNYEINIVPLLDVLLVLLLIFMATAPIIMQSVKVNLPNTIDSKIVSNKDNLPIIIEVSGINQYTLVINYKRIEQLSKQQIIAEAQAHLQANPKIIFLIGGAKKVPYEEIIKVLNILHQAGITAVGLMTQTI